MGLFATFNGLIYNDFMAIPLWIFKSCYHLTQGSSKHYAADAMHSELIPVKAVI